MGFSLVIWQRVLITQPLGRPASSTPTTYMPYVTSCKTVKSMCTASCKTRIILIYFHLYYTPFGPIVNRKPAVMRQNPSVNNASPRIYTPLTLPFAAHNIRKMPPL